MVKNILNLAWKELLQIYRDRILLAFMIVAPVLQLLLVAGSTGAGIRNLKLAVWDQERSDLSQRLISALANTDEFELAYRAQSYEELERLVSEGRAEVALIIPPDMSRNMQRPATGATVPAIVDGTNYIVANNVLVAVEGAVNDLALQNLARASQTSLPGGIELKIDTAFNPTLNVRWSTLPAQLAFITYQLVLVVAAVSFVRERELGTMEQLIVTPMSRLDVVLGKGVMSLLLGLLNFSLLILALTLAFQIPLRGSLVLLFGLGMMFIITEIGVGTLISMVTNSQQQSILLVFLLAILEITFSGFLVPTENMPMVMQLLASVSPLQHFTTVVRAIFVKGSDLSMLANHVFLLLMLAVLSTSTAWLLFRREEIS